MTRFALLAYILGGLCGNFGQKYLWAGFTILAASLFVYGKIKARK